MLSYVNGKTWWVAVHKLSVGCLVVFIQRLAEGERAFVGVNGETNMSTGVSITVSYILKTANTETHEMTWLIGTRGQKRHRKSENALHFKMMYLYHGFHKNFKQHNCFQHWLIRNVSWAENQHVRMISEGSCDTEDWSDDAENSALPSQE